MKKWSAVPCTLLLAVMAAAQTGSPVPAGTALMVRLETTLATFSNKAGDPFQARLTQAVVLNGKTLLPAGTMVEGRVTKVAEPRRISGKPDHRNSARGHHFADRRTLFSRCHVG